MLLNLLYQGVSSSCTQRSSLGSKPLRFATAQRKTLSQHPRTFFGFGESGVHIASRAPGGVGEAAAQVGQQGLDLVLAHGHRARQAQVVLRLHQPPLRQSPWPCQVVQ